MVTTVSVKDACKWYLKWAVLYVVVFVILIAAMTSSLGKDFLNSSSIWTMLMGAPIAILFFLFNYIVTDRIMQVKKTTILTCLLSNALSINVIITSYENIDEFIKYAMPYLNILPVVLGILFFYVVYQYAYAVYRLPVLLNILALTIAGVMNILLAKGSIDKESSFAIFIGLTFLILFIVSFIILYKTAKKYNM